MQSCMSACLEVLAGPPSVVALCFLSASCHSQPNSLHLSAYSILFFVHQACLNVTFVLNWQSKSKAIRASHFLPPRFETAQARWVCMWQDRLEDSEARSARLEATIASLRQEVDRNRTDRIVLNQPCVYTKHHACFFSVPVFTNVQVGAGVCRMEVLQDFADALGRWLPGGDNDPADCETPWGFEPTPLHELCVDTDRSHDGAVQGFIERTPHFLVLQVFLREADNYGCFRNDGTVDNSPVTVPPRWTPKGYDYHDGCDVNCQAPGCMEFGPTEWTNAFLDALAINK